MGTVASLSTAVRGSGGSTGSEFTVRDRPDVRYAHNGDVAIAYQVFGEGPVNLVCVPGFISDLYWNWELPEFSRMLTGLGSFARTVIMDRPRCRPVRPALP